MTLHQASAVLRPAFPRPEPVGLVKVQACRYGQMLYFPHDIFIGGSLERYGEYVEEETQMLLRYCKAGDIVVEVGANIGCHTVPLAQHVTNAGRVFAFEPQRIIYQMLCGNLAINTVWNVIAERVALGAASGILYVPPVNYAESGNFGSVTMGSEGGEPVQMLTLDAYNFTRCDLIKIDVEGMELEVLRGAEQTIRRLRPVLYVENDREDKKEALIRYLYYTLDYDLYWHCPPLFAADNFRGDLVNVFRQEGLQICSINMLCLPREKREPSELPPVLGTV